MAAMATEGEKRKLADLRVVDLRAELEKKGLDNKGVKATLLERLEKVLRDEGHDPEEYLFDIEVPKTPKRSSMKRGEQDTESETQSNADENHDTSMDVDEEGKEKEEEEEEEEKIDNAQENASKDVPQKAAAEEEEKAEEVSGETEPLTNGPDNEGADGNAKDGLPIETAKDLNLEETPTDGDKCVPEANGVDNEDSINLTIGEDEEKLLAEEEDSSSQEKEAKDEGERAGANAEEASSGGDGKKQAAGQKEDKKTTGEASKQDKSQEDNRDDKGGDKGKSTASAGEQKSSKDDKDKRTKPASTTGSSRNLWVSGLSSSTRATDLKQVFSKYGKVIGAKVVTNARTPGARCYGYVTMATSEDASKCIQHLHRTELHGRMISVERAKGDSAGPPRKGAEGRTPPNKKVEDKKRHERKPSTSSKTEEKKIDKEEKSDSQKTEPVRARPSATDSKKDTEDKPSEADAKDKPAAPVDVADKEKDKKEKSEAGEGEGDKTEAAAASSETRGSEEKGNHSREQSRDGRDRERHRSAGSSHYSHHSSHQSRPQSRSPHRRVFRNTSPSRRPGVLTFTQIREERERQRLRERERELREEDRRRREEMARQREIERRQREEAVRLEREKERLRVERERIEAERAELMRMERERQRLEREKLEREREELKRQQMRFEEARRSTKRPSDDRRETYPDERKRVATERRYDSSQSSRFDDSTRYEPPKPQAASQAVCHVKKSHDFQTKKEYKHGADFASRRSGYEEESHSARGESAVLKREASHEAARREHPVPDVSRGTDSRFERGPSFRVRDERRPESDHRPKVEMRHSGRDRYADSGKGDSRYSERSGDSWHSSSMAPVKPFASLGSSSVAARDTWASSSDRKSDSSQSWGRPLDSSSSDRWAGSSSSALGAVGRSGPGLGGPGLYSSQQSVPPNPPGISMGLSGSGPYSSDRFDSYKPSMGPIRKY